MSKDLKGKMFLDEDGGTWTLYSPAGTGEYSWWARHNDTGVTNTFSTDFVIKKVNSFESDIVEFENKEKAENDMFNLITKLSQKVLECELLDEENWSNEELKNLNKLMLGEFQITID